MRSGFLKWVTALSVGLLTVALFAPSADAQIPRGTLSGQVQAEDGSALPGVTVTASSPALQGTRVTVTDGNGFYTLRSLPPGDYEVTYELEGFQTKAQRVKISAAQDSVNDVQLGLAAVAEEIVVTGETSAVSETSAGSSTYTAEEIGKLAIGRDPNEAVALAPGVHNTGVSTAPSIQGAMSFENLFMINGVAIEDNIRGTPLPLFIEDAIEETTVSTSGISAEYGRFTGGVVNVITKSGGNELSGSFRTSFANDDWVSETPLTTSERTDEITEVFEATLGGYLWRDHLWFFGSGRDREIEETAFTTTPTSIGFPRTDAEQRFEGKLTLSPTASHTLVGSYLDYQREQTGATFGAVLDLRSLNVREDPQEYLVGNYTGILTPSLFVEAQYAERDFIIGKGLGGPPDLIDGTMVRDRPTAKQFWASLFCGSCEDEIRNSEQKLAKASYFLSTESLGSHDLAVGYDAFDDIRFSVNHQTGSDFQVWAERTVLGNDNTIYPVFQTTATWLVWWPPVGLDIARPTNFETAGYYVNDRWQLNDRWSFNLGVRYDENEGRNSSGDLVADDSKLSPRLGLSWDTQGDGDLVVNASYGTYVAKIANSGNVADATSTGGALAGFGWGYAGPPVNLDCQPSGANCVTTDVALQTMFDWYLANGGVLDINDDLSGLTNMPLIFACIPGVSQVVRETFDSPSTDEIAIGATKRLGNRGLLRADIVHREWEDFYADLTTLETGSTVVGGVPTDITFKGNYDSGLEREYIGLNLLARYRLGDRLTLSGNYTLSELEGNVVGETSGSGPVSAGPQQYPEYTEASWNFPVGRLNADQTHKLRVWGIYDLIDSERHTMSVSLLQNFWSGQPYGANAAILMDTATLDDLFGFPPIVNNPGYADPPDTVGYWFTDRDAFETDDITRTDLALNYSFNFNLFGKRIETFLQPEVLNVFDEQGVANLNLVETSVVTAADTTTLQPFNPFTTTPVEGVHWRKDPDFGEPTSENAFQTPRTYRFSVGFRF